MALATSNAFNVIVQAPGLSSYATVFPATEAAISEGGRWRDGLREGLQWTNPQTTLGDDGATRIACGTQSIHSPPPFDDSIACLTGFKPDHKVSGTIYRGPGIANQQEVELFLRLTITANSATGYEIDISDRQGQVTIVRWNGARDNFTPMPNGSFTTNVSTANGAFWEAWIIGNLITIRCNNLTVVSNYDVQANAQGGSVWSSGNPGMGFWRESTFGTPGPNNAFGWKTWRADDINTAPSWFSGLANSTWAVVGSNTMQSVSVPAPPNGFRTLTMPWVGAATDQIRKEFVIGAPGGHSDTGDNSVYVFRLNQTTPAWVATRHGDSATDLTLNGAGVTASNNPVDCHSYRRPVCARGRFWLPALDSMEGASGPTAGIWSTSCFSYDLAQVSNGAWRRHGRLNTTASLAKWLGGASAYDPYTDTIYSFPQEMDKAGGEWARFNASSVLAAADVAFPGQTPGVTLSSSFSGQNMYCAAVACYDLRIIVLIQNGSMFTLNLDNPGAGWTGRTFSGTPVSGGFTGDGGNIVYHEGTRKIYGYDSIGGSTVRVLDIPTNLSSTWAWRAVTPAGITPAGTASDNGSGGESRFQIIQDMGGTQACLLWYPTHTQTGMTVCKLPIGGL